MTELDIVRGAIKRIEQGWCKEDYARDAWGRRVSPVAGDACVWCLEGSIGLSFRGDYSRKRLVQRLEKSAGILGSGKTLADWNDEQLSRDTILHALRLVEAELIAEAPDAG